MFIFSKNNTDDKSSFSPTYSEKMYTLPETKS